MDSENSRNRRHHSAELKAQAIDYNLNAWEALTLHLDDRALAIDNNFIERQIKPWNWVARTGCSPAAH